MTVEFADFAGLDIGSLLPLVSEWQGRIILRRRRAAS